MEYIHPSSLPSSKSELSIFTVPPTQVAVDYTYDVEYRPSAALESSTVNEIDIPASEDFTDLSQTMVHLAISVNFAVDATGKATSSIAIDNLAHSFFEQVDFFIGSTNTSQASNLYHYQAYLEDLLFRHETKLDAGRIPKGPWLTKNIEAYFRLHLPMCQQDKLLLNGLPLLFRFSRTKAPYPVHSGNATISFTKFSLLIRRVKLFPDTQTGIISALKESPAKYFIIRNEVKSFSIPAGLNQTTIENVFSGILPRRIIIGLVTETGFSCKSDPYKFENADINHISLNINGNQYPSIPYTPKFPESCIREFVELYRVLGQDEGVPQLDLSFEQFKSSMTLFAFDIGGGICSETGMLSLLSRGAVRLEIRFGKATDQAYKAIIFGQFDNLITIDNDRNVTLDY